MSTFGVARFGSGRERVGEEEEENNKVERHYHYHYDNKKMKRLSLQREGDVVVK